VSSGDLEPGAPAFVGIVPGRSLMWSPAWECSDGRILFDRHSGDFWLLQGAAVDLVLALDDPGRLSWPQAVQRSGEQGVALLTDLARVGVIRAWNDHGDAVPLPDLADID
jgi:hypothetical protein